MEPDTLDLNGEWDFRFEPGLSLYDADPRFKATDTIPVPGCYDMMPKWLVKRGTGLYRRSFTLDADVRSASLIVDGMGLTGRFFIDGREIGASPLAWSRLEFETGPLAAGRHELFAALDNRFDPETQPLCHPYYDFYCYGGFYHGVSLELRRTPIAPRRILVRPRDWQTGEVELEVLFHGEARADFTADVRFDTSVDFERVAFTGGRARLQVPKARLWRPAAPQLHTVSVRAFGAERTERFGIRSFEAADGHFLLNGEPVFLKGANRHEARPDIGAATDEAQMRQDIELLKSIGGNFFRCVHYPQAQRFLDLCDEAGVLVWEESLGWGNTAKQLGDPAFIAAQIEQTRLMVENSFNHPSVVLFAFLNEFESGTPEGKSLADKLIDTIHAFDSGRPATFACNHTWDDICHERTDVFSFNAYPGWIGTNTDGTPEDLRRSIGEEVERIVSKYRAKYPGKPIVVSEMGTCGVLGFRDPAAAQWTEDFQAEYVGDVLDAVLPRPDIAGIAIWQFTDSRSYHRGGAPIRVKPFAQNLAGLFDGFRRPKLAADIVRAAFQGSCGGT